MKEFIIDVGKSPGIPWMHDEKPFRMRIHAETAFTPGSTAKLGMDAGRRVQTSLMLSNSTLSPFMFDGTMIIGD